MSVVRSFNLLLCCITLISLAWLQQNQFLLHWDVSWLRHCTEKWLAGGKYELNFFETTPPMILYCWLPSIVLQQSFHLNYIESIRGYIFLLCLSSFSLCFYLSHAIFTSNRQRILTLLALLIGLIILPSYEFGQKEHLLIIFFVPYLFLQSARLNGLQAKKWLSISIGCIAAVGLNIKPYFFIPYLLIESCLILKSRQVRAYLRPDTIAILLVSLIYLLSIFLLQPEYIYRMTPYAMRLYYLGMSQTPAELMQDPLLRYCLIVIPFYLVMSPLDSNKHFNQLLFLALLGFIACHFIQRMRVYYHLYPAVFCATLLVSQCFSQVITFSQRLTRRHYFLLVISLLFLTVTPFVKLTWTLLIFNPLLYYAFFSGLILALGYGFNTRPIIIIIMIALNLCLCTYFSFLLKYSELHAHRFLLTTLLAITLIVLCLPTKKTIALYVSLLSVCLFFYPVYDLFYKFQIYVRVKKETHAMVQMINHLNVHSFYLFTTATLLQSSLVDDAKLQTPSRFPFLWMVFGILKSNQVEQEQQILLAKINADLTRHQPDLLIFDATSYQQLLGNKFNYQTMLATHKSLRRKLQAYHYWKTLRFNGHGQYPYEFKFYRLTQSHLTR